MPTYEYRCPEGHLFEKFYSRMNDRRRLPCPTCGKMAERVISGAGLVFKGSGFYITDYKRAGEKRETDKTDKKEGESKTPSPESETPPPESSKKKDSGDK